MFEIFYTQFKIDCHYQEAFNQTSGKKITAIREVYAFLKYPTESGSITFVKKYFIESIACKKVGPFIAECDICNWKGTPEPQAATVTILYNIHLSWLNDLEPLNVSCRVPQNATNGPENLCHEAPSE